MAELRSPTTGEVLGTVAEATAEEVRAATDAAAVIQPQPGPALATKAGRV